MRVTRVALASYRGTTPKPDHSLLIRALARRRVVADEVPWDADADWAAYDLVILRSCWDYQYRAQEFFAWLGRLEAAKARVKNPPALVRWNARKTYLRDLAARGVTTVPTIFAAAAQVEDALRTALQNGWDEVILKPAIGASAWGVVRRTLTRSDVAEVAAACDPSVDTWLVQPFMPSVQRVGEYSLVFLDGRFSHAVVRRPAPDDFRVQQELGGSVHPVDAPRAARSVAERAIAALDGVPLYARADVIVNGGEAWLNELELIEPELFLQEKQAERFASEILRATSI